MVNTEKTNLMPMSLANIRSRCLDRITELLKDSNGRLNADFGISGVQDLKVQLIDCAGALAEFVISGKTTESLVGKTGLTVAASRALADRKVYMPVYAFNKVMREKGFMDSNDCLMEGGLLYGENRRVSGQWNGVKKAYYYDNRFDSLLALLGLDCKGQPKKR
ncbi:hypothetical protein [Bacteroides uniformis]|jgi:hypothetical protein|uniref:hypothetical protein n=2 Tax=Bacteroides uniformis TaxID=820 RepID=UPI0029785356|nr:hypothetical protein [Bacteroides uniformis]